MTEIKLIDGRFTADEAEQLIREFVNVKIKFHEAKMSHRSENEEDLKHSEKRIHELQRDLRTAVGSIKSASGERFDLHVNILMEPAGA